MRRYSKKCAACNGALTLFGPRRGYAYYLCTRCASLQLFPPPDEKELQAAYEREYASAKQTQEINDPDYWSTAGEAYRLDLLRTIADHGVTGLIVDFGAGWGHLCKMLIHKGYDCVGVEPSVSMAAYAEKKGIPVMQGSFDRLAQIRPVSCMVLCAVFEHLTAHRDALLRFNRAVAMGGTLISLHPTAACYTLLGYAMRLGQVTWELPELHGSFCPPWHTALFSLKGMAILARETGFEVVEIRPASQGDVGGMTGLVQQVLGAVNRVGWGLMGKRWPLVTTHIFVLRKVRDAT